MAQKWHNRWHKNGILFIICQTKCIPSDIIIENGKKVIMELRNYVYYATMPIVEEVERIANKISTDFVHSVRINLSPANTVRGYLDRLNELNSLWEICVKHNIQNGRKLGQIYVDGCNNYYMAHYIAERFNFQIHHGKAFKRINYTFDKFLDLAKMEVALLISKYEEVYRFEVEIAVLQLLLKFFVVYNINGFDDKAVWTFHPDDINKLLINLYGSEMSTFESYIKKIGDFMPLKRPQGKLVHKPQIKCKEDIMRCINKDMSQSEKIEAIMENWDISRRTAYRYMSMYGLCLSRSKQTAEYEVPELDDSTDPNIDELEKCGLLKNYISWQKSLIKKKEEEIIALNKEILELKEYIYKIENELNE